MGRSHGPWWPAKCHRQVLCIFLIQTKCRIKTFWPIAAVIPVLITGCPVITKWGDYSSFNIPTVAGYLSEQLWEC